MGIINYIRDCQCHRAKNFIKCTVRLERLTGRLSMPFLTSISVATRASAKTTGQSITRRANLAAVPSVGILIMRQEPESHRERERERDDKMIDRCSDSGAPSKLIIIKLHARANKLSLKRICKFENRSFHARARSVGDGAASAKKLLFFSKTGQECNSFSASPHRPGVRMMHFFVWLRAKKEENSVSFQQRVASLSLSLSLPGDTTRNQIGSSTSSAGNKSTRRIGGASKNSDTEQWPDLRLAQKKKEFLLN